MSKAEVDKHTTQFIIYLDLNRKKGIEGKFFDAKAVGRG